MIITSIILWFQRIIFLINKEMLMSIKNLTAALGLALALSTSAVYAETLQKQEQGQSVAPGIYRYTAVPQMQL